MDDDVHRRSCTQRIVESTQGPRHRPILIVLIVMSAVAGEESIARISLEDAELGVWPCESILRVRDRRNGLGARCGSKFNLQENLDRFSLIPTLLV